MARTDGQTPTSPTPQPSSTPHYLFDLSHIGKKMGDTLKEHGVYINGGVYQNVFGYFGGRMSGSEGQGQYNLGADFDLNQISGISGAAIHLRTDVRPGRNPAGYVGAGIFTTADYGPTVAYRLAELSWEQLLPKGHLDIMVGRISADMDFAASPIYCRFVFSTCGKVNAWYFNSANPSNPVANWGGRVNISLKSATYFKVGAYQETANQTNNLGWPGPSWTFANDIGVFIPVEVGYETNFDTDPYPRHFDIGGYYDSSRYTNPLGITRRGRSGFYLQGQQLILKPDAASHRGMTVFGEALIDTGFGGPVADQFVGGFSWLGPSASRPADSIQISTNYWLFNRDVAIASQRVSGLSMPVSQWQFELNYSYQLAPGISIQPAAGYVANPDGGLAAANLFQSNGRPPKNSWIVGAQLSIGFNDAFGLPALARVSVFKGSTNAQYR